MTGCSPSFPGRDIRRTWRINPVTRVHDNDIRRNKKKERQAAKKRLAEELKETPPVFFSLSNPADSHRTKSPTEGKTSRHDAAGRLLIEGVPHGQFTHPAAVRLETHVKSVSRFMPVNAVRVRTGGLKKPQRLGEGVADL